jgi:octanoyl-[GcvH]:protein N-octanoyltransferase
MCAPRLSPAGTPSGHNYAAAVLLLTTESWPPPALDAAVSAALLAHTTDTGTGSLRLIVPGRAVVFGRQDRARPGFRLAVAAAVEQGFAPVFRLAGGRAAVFHEGTVAIALAIADDRPRETIVARFAAVASAVAAAIRTFGVDARVGEVPGEYCPGSYSVNAAGARKVAGLGQRLVRRAAHVGGVVVVDRADLINEVLEPVYHHLGYGWDPATTGAVSDDVAVTVDDMVGGLAATIADLGYDLHPADLPAGVMGTAVRLAPEHDAAIA